MARPKSGKPPKDKIHLSVSRQTRMELDFIAQETNQSISQLMESWAKKEARRLAKAAGKQLPDATQMTIEEVATNAED